MHMCPIYDYCCYHVTRCTDQLGSYFFHPSDIRSSVMGQYQTDTDAVDRIGTSLLTRLFLMANPTLCILGSPAGLPFQKKVYPPFPLSVALPPVVSRIMLQCRHWTSAVPLLRRLCLFLVVHWSHCFRHQNYVFSVSDRMEEKPLDNTARKVARQTIFKAPFLAPSPTGVSSVFVPK